VVADRQNDLGDSYIASLMASVEQRGEAEPSGTLHAYVKVLRRRWRLLAVSIILVPLAAGVASARQHAKYQARSQVLLLRGSVANTLTGASDPSNAQTDDQIAQTQASVARATVIARRTLDAAGLDDRPTQALLSNSRVTPKTGTLVLEFSVTDRNRALAARIATAYAHQYTRFRADLSTEAIKKSLADVRAQIESLRLRSGSAAAIADLEERAQQLETLEVLQTANATVIREATSAAQTQPKGVRNVLLGLLVGIALGLGAVALREALDTRVRNEDVLLDTLDSPLLGRVPPPHSDFRGRRGVQSLAEPEGQYAEAFAIVRTSLELATVDQDVKVVAITSALAGEGKSTSAANLSVELARSGYRVLLVDLDLRRPVQSSLFGTGAAPGITRLALGAASLDEAAVTVPLGEPLERDGAQGALTVLPAGPLPPRPSDFITSAALKKALRGVRADFDLVVLDMPPLLPVGDVASLSTEIDGLIVVADLRLVRRQDLREMTRVLGTCRAPVLGCLLTGELDSSRYGYRYGYSYQPHGGPVEAADAPLPSA
jgi:receptor protein-tyrosine kinase